MDATKVSEDFCEKLRLAMLKDTATDWKSALKKAKDISKNIEATLQNVDGVEDIKKTLKAHIKEVEVLGLPESMTDTLCGLLASLIRTLTSSKVRKRSGKQTTSLLEVKICFDATSRAIAKVLDSL